MVSFSLKLILRLSLLILRSLSFLSLSGLYALSHSFLVPLSTLSLLARLAKTSAPHPLGVFAVPITPGVIVGSSLSTGVFSSSARAAARGATRRHAAEACSWPDCRRRRRRRRPELRRNDRHVITKSQSARAQRQP